jgi:hypothetical protein
MKTKILGGIAIVAIAIAVALNVNMTNKKSDKTSLLALANVEALAQSEGEGTKGYPSTKTITNYFYDDNGRLIRSETHNEPCCASGSLPCSANPC